MTLGYFANKATHHELRTIKIEHISDKEHSLVPNSRTDALTHIIEINYEGTIRISIGTIEGG